MLLKVLEDLTRSMKPNQLASILDPEESQAKDEEKCFLDSRCSGGGQEVALLGRVKSKTVCRFARSERRYSPFVLRASMKVGSFLSFWRLMAAWGSKVLKLWLKWL